VPELKIPEGDKVATACLQCALYRGDPGASQFATRQVGLIKMVANNGFCFYPRSRGQSRLSCVELGSVTQRVIGRNAMVSVLLEAFVDSTRHHIP
jgi:hypothetical protein